MERHLLFLFHGIFSEIVDQLVDNSERREFDSGFADLATAATRTRPSITSDRCI